MPLHKRGKLAYEMWRVEVGVVIQAPRKSNGIELSYEHAYATREASGVRRIISSRPDAATADELDRLHQQLREVREWADRGEWRESGSDGLYAILSEGRR